MRKGANATEEEEWKMVIKVILEQIIEIDVDSLEDLDMDDLPIDMEEVDYLNDEARVVTTSLLSSEILD
jgi:hypothetical protein